MSALPDREPLLVIRDAARERADHWAREVSRISELRRAGLALGRSDLSLTDALFRARRNLDHHLAAIGECDRRLFNATLETSP